MKTRHLSGSEFRESPQFSCIELQPSFQKGTKANQRRDLPRAPKQICGEASKRTQQNLGSQPCSYSSCLFCLCKLTEILGYTLYYTIDQPYSLWLHVPGSLGRSSQMSDSTGKNSDPDEQFARGCKTSLRAGRWLEGRTSAGTFTSTAQMGLFASIPAATQYLQCSETKGTKSRTVQIVTLSRARREFRAGLHEPSGGRRGQLRTNYSRSQVFQLGQA